MLIGAIRSGEPGWDGVVCEHDIDECLSFPCENSATCIQSFDADAYECTCEYGWAGENCAVIDCETYFDELGNSCTDYCTQSCLHALPVAQARKDSCTGRTISAVRFARFCFERFGASSHRLHLRGNCLWSYRQ